jgi:Cu2+-exporting ATPase
MYLLVIRPEFRAALARLKALGIWAMMLTGHATAVARWVARELALDEFFAEVLPTRFRAGQRRLG